MRILLAEDEEALSRAYATALSYQGHEVEQAFDGEQAVEKAARNPYDVMIFDVMMPKKTGDSAFGKHHPCDYAYGHVRGG